MSHTSNSAMNKVYSRFEVRARNFASQQSLERLLSPWNLVVYLILKGSILNLFCWS